MRIFGYTMAPFIYRNVHTLNILNLQFDAVLTFVMRRVEFGAKGTTLAYYNFINNNRISSKLSSIMFPIKISLTADFTDLGLT